MFLDALALQSFDPDPSAGEDRFLLLAPSSLARVLLICPCERSGGEVIRIISARRATPRESQAYGGGQA